jgi:hypothetical protein
MNQSTPPLKDPLFQRKTLLLILAAFLVAFIVSGAGTAVLDLGRMLPDPAAKQPIAFNHAKHVKELDLGCPTCHVTVEKEAFSGLPGADVCVSCHEEVQGKSDEEKKLVALLKEGKPLLWQPLFRQPAHVFYSHRRHVVTAKIECKTCHGSIAESTQPLARVRKLRMDDCLDCHRRTGGPKDCTGCHR